MTPLVAGKRRPSRFRLVVGVVAVLLDVGSPGCGADPPAPIAGPEFPEAKQKWMKIIKKEYGTSEPGRR